MTPQRGWAIAGGVALVALMIVLFVVCSGEESGDSTTTSGVSSTTSLAQTTTTPPPETTTSSVAETTTTVAETTTTVDDGLLEGNWAPQPLIVSQFFVGALGWWDGEDWIQAADGDALPIVGGEDYQVARLGTEGITTGGPEVVACDFSLPTPGVELEDPDIVGTGYPDPVGVAISAPWPMTPHLVEETEDDGTYATIAAGLLAERGLDVPDPVIKQVVRFDIEGDGVNEVAVVAEDMPPDLLGEGGEYSIVFVQRVVAGTVQTVVLDDFVFLEVEEEVIPTLYSFGIGAVADLNGDERMELVLTSTYYEGSGVSVFEYLNDELGFVPQIGAGCGV